MEEGTIVDLIQPQAISRAALKAWFLNGNAKFKGNVGASVLTPLDRVLHRSRRIARRIKRLIVPEANPS